MYRDLVPLQVHMLSATAVPNSVGGLTSYMAVLASNLLWRQCLSFFFLYNLYFTLSEHPRHLPGIISPASSAGKPLPPPSGCQAGCFCLFPFRIGIRTPPKIRIQGHKWPPARFLCRGVSLLRLVLVVRRVLYCCLGPALDLYEHQVPKVSIFFFLPTMKILLRGG